MENQAYRQELLINILKNDKKEFECSVKYYDNITEKTKTEVMTFQNLANAGSLLFVNFLVDGIGKISKLQTQLGKDFGLSQEQVKGLRFELAAAANAQGTVAVNSMDTQRALVAINEQFGIRLITYQRNIEFK